MPSKSKGKGKGSVVGASGKGQMAAKPTLSAKARKEKANHDYDGLIDMQFDEAA